MSQPWIHLVVFDLGPPGLVIQCVIATGFGVLDQFLFSKEKILWYAA